MRKQDMIKKLKEEIKNDWNYVKGVSLVKNIVEKLIEEFAGDFGNLEEMYEEIRFNVAKTGSIYISLDIFEARISDHSSSALNREVEKTMKGSVCGNVFVKYNF